MSQETDTFQDGTVSVSASGSSLRLFTKGQITAATFIGSPIAGCWLMAENYKAVGLRLFGRQSLVLGALATLVVFVLAVVLPENFPNSVLPGIYTLLMNFIVSVKQGGILERQFRAGALRHSNWRVLGIGIVWMIVVLASFVAIAFAIPESVWVYIEGNS